MGATAQLKTNGVVTLIAIGTLSVFLTVMLYNPTYPWYFDVFVALGLSALTTAAIYVPNGYRQAFSRVYALERRDFTDPGYVTGWVRVYLASLGFYYRPEVWRGNDGRNGIGSPDSVVVLSCGEDVVTWTYDEDDPDWDSDVWCTVEPGPQIKDFRTPLDYFDLPADRFTTTPTSIKHRRSWCRDLMRSGERQAVWEKGAMSMMDGRWPWLAVGGFMIVGLFGIFMAVGLGKVVAMGHFVTSRSFLGSLGLLFVSISLWAATFPAVDSWHDQWRDYAHRTELGGHCSDAAHA